MAIPQVNGEWRFSTIWGSETLEPIELKFGTINYVRHAPPHAKIGGRLIKEVRWGMGEIVTSRAFIVSRIRPQLTLRMSA